MCGTEILIMETVMQNNRNFMNKYFILHIGYKCISTVCGLEQMCSVIQLPSNQTEIILAFTRPCYLVCSVGVAGYHDF